MGLTKLAVRFTVPVPKPEQFGRFLFVGPHPDDIEIGAGATAAKLTAEGKQVAFLICTDGRYGRSHLPMAMSDDEVAALRKQEAIRSAGILGVKDVRFLELSDGGFYTRKELEIGIADAIGTFRPDIIFAPDPKVKSECHADHLNVGNACMKLAEFAPYEGIMRQYGAACAPVKAIALYMTADVNCSVNTGGYFRKQMDAVFQGHQSQFPENSADARSLRLYLKLRAADYGLRRGCRTGEGFRILGQTQMHCLPESR